MSPNSSEGSVDPLSEAIARHQAGDLAAARSLYQAHLQATPDDVRAWCLLASVEGQSGRHDLASEAYEHAIAIDPGCVPAHAGLGTSRLHRQDFEGAADSLRRTLELDGSQVEARIQLASALRRLARLPEATAVLEAALELAPDHPQARFNLGMSQLEGGMPDKAEDSFRRVLERHGGVAPAHAGLGRAFMAQNRLDEAAAALERALEIAPDNPETAIALGNLMTARGRLEQACVRFEDVLARHAGHPQALSGLAELDRLSGHPERGLGRLDSIGPGQVPGGVVLMNARLLNDAGRAADAADFIRERLDAEPLMPGVGSGLRRELGRALDRLKDHDGAWAAWTDAHRGADAAFEPAHFAEAVDALIGAYGAALFRTPAPADRPDGPRPLLLIGAPRSGKSILEQMLACHPAIHGAGELRFLGGIVGSLQHDHAQLGPYPASIGRLDAPARRALAGRYRDTLRNVAPSADWVTDTQPTNFLHAGLARLLADDVRVVYCRRDPVDLAWACYGRGFADAALAFAATPAGIVSYLEGLERVVAHWHEVLPEGVITVDYEQLVRTPESALRRVLDALGVPWSKDCDGYWEPGRASLSVAPTLSGPVTDAEVGRGAPYRERFPGIATGDPDAPRG